MNRHFRWGRGPAIAVHFSIKPLILKRNPQPPEPTLPKGQGRVFVLLNDKPGEEKEESRIIAIGATDGIYTEVTDPNLPVGTKIITDETDESAAGGKKKGPF